MDKSINGNNSENSLGILGGSFNPIHNGHLMLASKAISYFKFNKVIFIPACIQPQKEIKISAAHRIKMLELAVKKHNNFSVWYHEIDRGGLSYSSETLKILRKEHPGTNLYFIIGSDNLTEIPTWHRYRDILDMATLCVAKRPDYSIDAPDEIPHECYITFPVTPDPVSSTQIRNKIRENDPSWEAMVPEEITGYIYREGLYLNN